MLSEALRQTVVGDCDLAGAGQSRILLDSGNLAIWLLTTPYKMSPQSHQRGSKMRATVLAAALGLSLVVASSVVDAQHGPVVSGTQASDFTTPPASCDTAIIGGGPGAIRLSHAFIPSLILAHKLMWWFDAGTTRAQALPACRSRSITLLVAPC